jgi:hypothetical protein
MAVARFKVQGQLDSAGQSQPGTVMIDRAVGLFSVRPRGRRKLYELPLDRVATMVCQAIIKVELADKRRAKKEKIRVRRGL